MLAQVEDIDNIDIPDYWRELGVVPTAVEPARRPAPEPAEPASKAPRLGAATGGSAGSALAAGRSSQSGWNELVEVSSGRMYFRLGEDGWNTQPWQH